jgi:hypothetical protein
MDLIDRYLIAVRRQLPRHLQDDVIAELTDSLRSEAEDHERASGRPMTEEEQAALLKERGHPFVMAGRYLPQQQLIGPALFLYYRQALKFVVFWVVVPISLFGAAIHAIYSNSPSAIIARAIGAAWNGAIYSVGIVTIVFAILEHERVRINVLDNWNPAKLPEPKPGRAVPRSETIVSLVVALTFLVYWTTLVRVPEIVFYADDQVRFIAAPIWRELYIPILVSLVASSAVSLIDLIRPWRTLITSAAALAVQMVNVFIITQLLRAGRYVEVSGAPGAVEKLTMASHWVNQIVEWVAMTAGVIILFELCFEIWRMVQARRHFRAAISSTAP